MLCLPIRKISLVTVVSCFILTTLSCADHQDDESQLLDANNPMNLEDRIDWIHKQIIFLQSKAKKVNDSARLQYTNVLVGRVRDSIKKLGIVEFLIDSENTNRLHALVRELDNSQGFFDFIRTEETNDTITSFLFETVSEENPFSLMNQIKYKKRIMGTITFDNVTIMHERLLDLRATSDLPPKLRIQLERPIASSGLLIAKAKVEGDRPVVHKKATELTAEIEAIYPLFDECIGTSHLFEMTQTIRGVNEFLKDYVQVEAMKKLK